MGEYVRSHGDGKGMGGFGGVEGGAANHWIWNFDFCDWRGSPATGEVVNNFHLRLRRVLKKKVSQNRWIFLVFEGSGEGGGRGTWRLGRFPIQYGRGPEKKL